MEKDLLLNNEDNKFYKIFGNNIHILFFETLFEFFHQKY